MKRSWCGEEENYRKSLRSRFVEIFAVKVLKVRLIFQDVILIFFDHSDLSLTSVFFI